jgi:hypothetical protein
MTVVRPINLIIGVYVLFNQKHLLVSGHALATVRNPTDFVNIEKKIQ